MALNDNTLRDLIITELKANTFIKDENEPSDKKYQTPGITLLVEGIAKAVVSHIKSNAVVTTTSGAPDGEHTGTIS
jgi:hypothetical protein